MPTNTLHNEDVLLLEMQEGSEQAFTTIYLHHSPKLYLSVLKMVRDQTIAAEIVQDVFTKIWLKQQRLSIETNFSGYLFRVTQNRVVDHFRKLKTDRRLREQFILLAGTEMKSEEILTEELQQESLLKKALEQLSPQQKKVFELVRIEGYTYKKAATIMGISPHTVKEYLANTSKALKSFVLAHSGEANHLLWLVLLLSFLCRQ